MRRLLIAALFVSSCAPSARAPKGPPTDRPDTPDIVAAELWELQMRRYPTWATYIGDRRYDGELTDVSEAAHVAHLEALKSLLSRVEVLEVGPLAGQPRVTAQVVRVRLENALATEQCRRRTWDVDQLGGYHVRLAELGAYQRVDSARSAADYVLRLSKIPALFRQHLDNLRNGISAGRVAPKVNVERVIAQLDEMLKAPVGDSPYLAVMKNAQLPEREMETLRNDIGAVIRTGIRPALADYRDFLTGTYTAAAREAVGVSANAEGAACYQALIAHHTGSTLSAQEIHDTGLTELKRLRGEMLAVAKSEGFADVPAFVKSLERAKEQHVTSRDALIEHNRELVKKAEAALPNAFGILPPVPVEITPIEEFREKDAPAAYYYSAADDGSRPAYYYINTYQPETRPLYNMEALAYHEAVPGHHLQIAIAQSLEDLPMVRRHSHVTAYVEGWALYAELVADELGLYSSAATRYGMLNYQAWRAARLVVDTGMHALGWTRQQALDFMAEHVSLPEKERTNEIDRYIIWPGQALAYMLGRMEIQRLRSEAESKLGKRFDVRDFHDTVLENGAVPMVVLAEIVADWVAGGGG